MGQFMSRRYQLCHYWPRLSVAQVVAEACLDPISAAPSGLCLVPEMPFSSTPHIAHTSCVLLSTPFLTITDTFPAYSPMP
jgi:hypothetical protein